MLLRFFESVYRRDILRNFSSFFSYKLIIYSTSTRCLK